MTAAEPLFEHVQYSECAVVHTQRAVVAASGWTRCPSASSRLSGIALGSFSGIRVSTASGKTASSWSRTICGHLSTTQNFALQAKKKRSLCWAPSTGWTRYGSSSRWTIHASETWRIWLTHLIFCSLCWSWRRVGSCSTRSLKRWRWKRPIPSFTSSEFPQPSSTFTLRGSVTGT